MRFPYRNGDLRARGKPERIADLSSGGELTGGGHWTRDIVLASARLGTKLLRLGRLEDERQRRSGRTSGRERARGSFQFEPDGSNRTTYAWGIRNAVGIAIQPETGDLWASVRQMNGTAWETTSFRLRHPRPEKRGASMAGHGIIWEITRIPATRDLLSRLGGQSLGARWSLIQAHSAPLNLIFYEGERFPARLQGGRVCRSPRFVEQVQANGIQGRADPSGELETPGFT